MLQLASVTSFRALSYWAASRLCSASRGTQFVPRMKIFSPFTSKQNRPRSSGRLMSERVEFHGTQTDSLGIRIDDLPVGSDQFGTGLIECRIAVPSGPPQIGILAIR